MWKSLFFHGVENYFSTKLFYPLYAAKLWEIVKRLLKKLLFLPSKNNQTFSFDYSNPSHGKNC